MKLIYIAGPFTPRYASVEHNIRRAEALAVDLVRVYGGKVHPVVPHSAGRVLFGVQSEEDAIAGTLELQGAAAKIIAALWQLTADAGRSGNSTLATSSAEAVKLLQEGSKAPQAQS